MKSYIMHFGGIWLLLLNIIFRDSTMLCISVIHSFLLPRSILAIYVVYMNIPQFAYLFSCCWTFQVVSVFRHCGYGGIVTVKLTFIKQRPRVSDGEPGFNKKLRGKVKQRSLLFTGALRGHVEMSSAGAGRESVTGSGAHTHMPLLGWSVLGFPG